MRKLYREAHLTKVLDTIRFGRITRTDRLTKNTMNNLNVTSSGFAKCNGANLYREAHLIKVLDTIRFGRITRTDSKI